MAITLDKTRNSYDNYMAQQQAKWDSVRRYDRLKLAESDLRHAKTMQRSETFSMLLSVASSLLFLYAFAVTNNWAAWIWLTFSVSALHDAYTKLYEMKAALNVITAEYEVANAERDIRNNATAYTDGVNIYLPTA